MKYDLLKFAKLTGKENLIFKKLIYYNATPFQSTNPTKDERQKKENYDNFVDKLTREVVAVKEGGRYQRLSINGKYCYKQKGVDTLISMDLSRFDVDNPNIEYIILIAYDSDFVPAIKALEKRSIKTILYTYTERGRKSIFSSSNYLLDCVQTVKKDSF